MSGMYDPAHPVEIIREAIVAKGWTVAEAAACQLACASRGTRCRGC